MRYQDSCYLNVSKPANWPRAKQECISRHSQLVTIYNEDVFKSVAALAENFSWIGAEWNENKSKHVWLDGSDIEFQPPIWKNGNEDGTLCVGIRDSASSNQRGNVTDTLQREKCAHVRPYICERKGEYNQRTNNKFKRGLIS